MSLAALEFEGVGKVYRPPGAAYRSLRSDVMDAVGRSGKLARPSPVDALRDLSFSIAPGESMGVIGPNGAGKSTALRIAARVTVPSAGRVRVRGRVGALIEVGAGIHPELTGRENIRLYGAILGLSRRQVRASFDGVVAFAEIGHALDLPVKRYSSGMQLRLGFAVATAVAPDVLVVDEALAVGDARFQLRCLARMAELVAGGTALVYVSHDLASVEAVCPRALLLLGGEVAAIGPSPEVVGAYLRWVDGTSETTAPGALVGADGTERRVVAPGEEVWVRVPLPAGPGPFDVALGVRDGHPWNLLGAATTTAEGADGAAWCRIRSLPLAGGVYQVWAAVSGDAGDTAGAGSGVWRQLATFRVEEPGARARPIWLPGVDLPHEWLPRGPVG